MSWATLVIPVAMIFAAMQGDFGYPLMPFGLTIYMIVPALISHFALALGGEMKNW